MSIPRIWKSLTARNQAARRASNAAPTTETSAAAHKDQRISYAQNFEDVVLHRVFRNQKTGFYIDIGAFDPTIDSVTRHFYDHGWSGVNVEPVERFHAAFVRDRPRDVNLCLAVGDHEGTIKFHEWTDTGLSTADERFVATQLETHGFRKTIRTVTLTTLATICDQAAGQTIDFLKIDVEGLEREVLLGADWQRHRPRVVLVEAIQPIVPGDDPINYTPTWHEWEEILLGNGYSFALFDGLNRFYYRNEEPGIRPLLEVPANIRDGFTLAKQAG